MAHITPPKIYPEVPNIVQSVSGLFGEPFLNSKITISDFQLAGNLDVDIDKLNNIDKGRASPLPNCLKNIAGRPFISALFLFLFLNYRSN